MKRIKDKIDIDQYEKVSETFDTVEEESNIRDLIYQITNDLQIVWRVLDRVRPTTYEDLRNEIHCGGSKWFL